MMGGRAFFVAVDASFSQMRYLSKMRFVGGGA
jgi:hypothetical protein